MLHNVACLFGPWYIDSLLYRMNHSQWGHCYSTTWWRHQMETSYALLTICAENSPVNSPQKGQRRGALMFFFDLHLNERLSKQSWGWWLETPLCPSWRHCDYFRREISSWKPPLWLIQWHLVNYSSYSFEDRIRLSFICWYPTFKSVSVTWRG